jgi:carbonic anhydrase/acetyltransferase-like protein (isoleucine patch superfamily)
MLILPYGGKSPQIGSRVYIAENATVIGDVIVGDDASIWFGTVVRGDVHSIRIGQRANIQDNCVVHVTNDTWPTTIGDDVTIGHLVVAHGTTIGRGALIGMGSRLLDGSVIGEECIIGAGALVTEGMNIPARTLAIGFPARVKRELTADELERLKQSSRNYVEYKNNYLAQRA